MAAHLKKKKQYMKYHLCFFHMISSVFFYENSCRMSPTVANKIALTFIEIKQQTLQDVLFISDRCLFEIIKMR